MYQHFGTRLVWSASDDPHVSLYAAKRADGALTLMFINMKDTPVEKALKVAGFKMGGAAEAWLFDAGHKAEKLSNPVMGEKINLPAQSMLVLVIPNS